MNPARILLAEDHALVREGIRLLLGVHPDFAIAGEAADGETAVRLALELAPDVVVLDLELPKLHGIEVARRIKAANEAVKILVLTASLDGQAVRAALAAGADAYVVKQEDSGEFIAALRTVMAGGTHVSAGIGRAFAPAPGAKAALVERLTARELEIVRLIAAGHSSQEIAEHLAISVPTVRKHRENLMRKLDLHNAAEVAAFAIRNALCGPM